METNQCGIPTEVEIINGGLEVQVKLKGSLADPVPRLCPVFVRIVPPKSIRSLAFAWGQEDKEIPIYLNKLPGDECETFLDSLHPEGWELLISEGRRLNFTSFSRWSKRSQAAVRAVSDDQGVEKMVEALAKTEEGRALLKNAAGQ